MGGRPSMPHWFAHQEGREGSFDPINAEENRLNEFCCLTPGHPVWLCVEACESVWRCMTRSCKGCRMKVTTEGAAQLRGHWQATDTASSVFFNCTRFKSSSCQTWTWKQLQFTVSRLTGLYVSPEVELWSYPSDYHVNHDLIWFKSGTEPKGSVKKLVDLLTWSSIRSLNTIRKIIHASCSE